MRIKNETAVINSSIAILRRDVDNLGASIKEKIEKMRHECVFVVIRCDSYLHCVFRNQLELDNRKHEARTDLKHQALMIEVGCC
jgi:hypothetical protein